jgi:cellulose synthase/poly-beta-1,6-N-acetylglucosamine synthase-like glycosyltransferase
LQILSVVFFVAVGLQLVYLLIFILAFFRKQLQRSNTELPISVLVCAHDEELNLKELIPSLLSQEYPKFEVIVVNDQSNDGTYDFLLEETKARPQLRMVNVDKVPAHINGKKFGITLGIKAATYEWILLTDADCRPVGKQWLAGMSQQFDEEADFVLGFSPYEKRRGFLNLFIRFESILTALQYFAFALLRNPYMGVGRNLAYRKSLFLNKKGFNQFLNVTGGDDDLFVNQHAQGKKTRVSLSPETHITSTPKLSWSAFFHQKVRHLAVGKRYRAKHRILLGVFTLTWILTWFAGIALLIVNVENWMVWAGIALRIILLSVAVRTFIKHAAHAFELWALPILDFLYSIYYLSTGLVALLTKRIRWRK